MPDHERGRLVSARTRAQGHSLTHFDGEQNHVGRRRRQSRGSVGEQQRGTSDGRAKRSPRRRQCRSTGCIHGNVSRAGCAKRRLGGIQPGVAHVWAKEGSWQRTCAPLGSSGCTRPGQCLSSLLRLRKAHKLRAALWTRTRCAIGRDICRCGSCPVIGSISRSAGNAGVERAPGSPWARCAKH